MAKPKKGVIPPQLRKYLFKRRAKKKAATRVARRSRYRRARVARPRRRNPSGIRRARRALSRTVYGIITAERGGIRLMYDGRHFSRAHAPRKFPTLSLAESTARRLLKQYPVLRGYKVYIRTTH